MADRSLDSWVDWVLDDVAWRLDRADDAALDDPDRLAAVDDIARFMAGRGGDDDD